MYVCMYVCIYVCMYVYMYECMHVCILVHGMCEYVKTIACTSILHNILIHIPI